MTEPAAVRARDWDVLVIGTGMGGATLGFALAKAGKSVLFCERGKSLFAGGDALRGNFAETFFGAAEVPRPKHQATLFRSGRYPDEVADTSAPRVRRFIPFIGTGTGGSSALYGMALERLFPADFTPRRYHPDAADSTLPEEWPFRYEDLRPHYDTAEALYRVRGSPDPCRQNGPPPGLVPPPPLSAAAQELSDFLRGKGLHPYQLPSACESVPGCQGCQGFLCPRECKNDSTRVCLKPALAQYGAQLLDECEVRKLEATREAITAVRCSRRGEEFTLRAGVVVLAAGALETPRLLLASASPEWPQGLANDSGLVGRNLMRHYIDLYAVAPHTAGEIPVSLKELAFNDFYLGDGQKGGTVQSFGALPPPPVLVAGMQEDLRHGSFRWAAPLFGLAKPLMKSVFGRLLSRKMLFASILEDLPYADNRVALPSPGEGARLVIEYRLRDHERARIAAFREKINEAFRPYRVMVIKQAENNERIAHACGTCRAGHDPRTSVLDAWNRAHGLANLYVVDASFFPSSGGTNPALTIAANALRVADHLIGKGPAHV
jgi:choline dehydrogenase-like flavoprotein